MRVKNLCESVKTGLSINLCLTRMIHINKTHAEKCRFTVAHIYHVVYSLSLFSLSLSLSLSLPSSLSPSLHM